MHQTNMETKLNTRNELSQWQIGELASKTGHTAVIENEFLTLKHSKLTTYVFMRTDTKMWTLKEFTMDGTTFNGSSAVSMMETLCEMVRGLGIPLINPDKRDADIDDAERIAAEFVRYNQLVNHSANVEWSAIKKKTQRGWHISIVPSDDERVYVFTNPDMLPYFAKYWNLSLIVDAGTLVISITE